MISPHRFFYCINAHACTGNLLLWWSTLVFLYLTKLFCDHRAYVYTRSMWRQVSSNLLSICAHEIIEKKNLCEYYQFLFFSISALLSFIFFFLPNNKRNWLVYCLFLFMQIREKEDDDDDVHRRMLIIFVNSDRGRTYSFEQMKSKPTDEQPNWTPYE